MFSLFTESDWIDEQQFSILHKAVLGISDRGLTEELRTSIAMMNTIDAKGRTPLMWAAARGDTSNVQTLLDHGADPNVSDVTGNTALLRAATAYSPSVIVPLLDAGAEVNWTSEQGYTMLHYASYYGNHADILTPMLERGAQIEAKDSYGWTPLACTSEYDHEESAAELIRHGANVNTRCNAGWTPLLRAVNSNSHKVLQLLLASNANPCITSFRSETALHFVARRGDLRSIEILTNANLRDLDPRARTSQGQTASDLMTLRHERTADTALSFTALLRKLG